MKFCTACGKEVLETAVVCIGCGSALGNNSVVCDVEPWTQGKMIGYGILSFLLPLVGGILAIIGLTKEPRRMQGAILMGITIFALFFWSAIMK